MARGGDVWMGTNQVRAKWEGARSSDQAGQFGSGFQGAGLQGQRGASGILGAAKYTVKDKEIDRYSF